MLYALLSTTHVLQHHISTLHSSPIAIAFSSHIDHSNTLVLPLYRVSIPSLNATRLWSYGSTYSELFSWCLLSIHFMSSTPDRRLPTCNFCVIAMTADHIDADSSKLHHPPEPKQLPPSTTYT